MADSENTAEQGKPHPLREIVQPFVDAARAPRPVWGNNLQYFLEGFIYFGILNYLVIYCIENIGLTEVGAGWVVTFLAGITIILLGYGLYEPASYSIVRQVTTAKTSAMGFAMLYALMNLGGWLLSFLGPARRAIGIGGLYWVFTGITLISLLLTAVILNRRTMTEASASARAARGQTPVTDDPEAVEKKSSPHLPWTKRVLRWLREHPMADPRFLQYVAETAPEDKMGAYLGVARLPWFLTKMITGLYAGWFLMHYVPEDGVLNTGTMWFWYGIIAMITPVMLILASRWMKQGFEE